MEQFQALSSSMKLVGVLEEPPVAEYELFLLVNILICEN
jgi:hypothetical protein